MATFPSKVNYATGDILTATNMNDIGGAINLLDGAQTSGAKNRVLNSQMNVWQRGTSIAVAASSGLAYTADRWATSTAASQACTVSRQATGDTTNLPFIQYAMRFQRNSGQTGTAAINLVQSMETINSVPLAGKAISFSFYARAGANFSAASSSLGVFVIAGTGTDQNWFGGYTGQTLPVNSAATLTTTWQRFTYTGTVAATVTELSAVFNFTPTGTAGANDYFEITGIQLEAANSVSPYAPNGATYQAELAACQRYYYRQNANAASAYAIFGTGFANTTGLLNIPCQFPVTMRTKPTALDTAAMATYGWEVGISSGNTPTTVTIDSNYSSADSGMAVVAKAASFVVATYYRFEANGNSGAYLGWSAEL